MKIIGSLKAPLKAVGTASLVGNGPTKIRMGPLKGWLLPASVARANLSMLLGRYEQNVVGPLMEIASGCEVAYDIGAHVGFMSLILKKALHSAGIVYAFEPSPREVASLEELISCNQLGGQLHVVPCAVSWNDGPVLFRPNSFVGILREAPQNRDPSAATLTVESVTLDSFVFEKANPAPDVMKIDVESAEALVLRGARRLLRTKNLACSSRFMVPMRAVIRSRNYSPMIIGFQESSVTRGGAESSHQTNCGHGFGKTAGPPTWLPTEERG